MMNYWKAVAIVQAIVLLNTAMPRLYAALKIDNKDRCHWLTNWFHQSNFVVAGSVALALIILISAFFV